MSIHHKLMWIFAAIAAALFAAKYIFDVAAVGYWTFLPLVFFFWASWAARREERSK